MIKFSKKIIRILWTRIQKIRDPKSDPKIDQNLDPKSDEKPEISKRALRKKK